MRWNDVLLAGITFISLVSGGCGRQSLPSMAPVRGQLTLDGTPLAKGIIMFHPDRTKGLTGRMAVGVTGTDGRFELSTFHPGDGAIIGHHVVAVVCETEPPTMEQAKMSPPPVVRSRIPKKYNLPGSSGLKFEVKPGAVNNFLLELRATSSDASSSIPKPG
jgi:hypothetical protein